MLRLRVSDVLPTHPLHAFMLYTRTTFTFTLKNTLIGLNNSEARNKSSINNEIMAWGFPYSDYSVPNQPKLLFNGMMTESEYRKVSWREKHNSLREIWSWYVYQTYYVTSM